MPLTKLENELRQVARERIQDGRLPNEIPTRDWAGIGNNAPCSLCDKVIRTDEVEYELESVVGGAKRIHRFHFLCHAAWQIECARYKHLSGTDPSPP